MQNVRVGLKFIDIITLSMNEWRNINALPVPIHADQDSFCKVAISVEMVLQFSLRPQ